MRGSKIPVQELWLKMGGGRIREGGVIAGFYGNMEIFTDCLSSIEYIIIPCPPLGAW